MTTALLNPSRLLLGASLAAILGAGAALAQVETIDTDGDGMVSYTELLLVMPDMTEGRLHGAGCQRGRHAGRRRGRGRRGRPG
jgi:hypothetical protein